MADITVTTDFSQVNNLKEALQSADTAYVRVVDSVVRENNRLKSLLKKAAKDTEETNKIKEQADAIYTAKMQQEADKRERVRAREAAKAEKEAQRIEAANQKLIASEVKLRAESEKRAAASAQGFQSQIGGNLGLGARGISASASGSAFEGEIERLRQKYDQVYASSQLYERSLNELNKAHALGVLSAKQHESAVESLNQEYQNFQNGTAGIGNRFAQNVQQNMAGVSNAGVLMQQLGYQAGDFIVQIQSGTNAFVAFGQQATQMVGFLPMFAQSMGLATVSILGFNVAIAPLTLGLSIIIPLLTAAGAFFMRTGESAKTGSEGIDTYAGALKALTGEIKTAQQEFLKLRFDTESLGVAGTKEQLQQLEARLRGLTELRDRLVAGGGQAAARVGLLPIEDLEAEKAVLEEQLGVLQQIELSQNYLEASRKRTSREPSAPYKEEAAYAKMIAEETARSEELARRKKDAFHAMAGEMGAVSSALFDANGFLESMSPLQREIYEYGQKFAQTDLASGVDAAAAAALALAQRLGISLDRAKGMMELGYGAPIQYDPRAADYDPARASAGSAAQLQKDRFGFSYSTTVQGTKFADDKEKGGGGGKGDPLEELRKQIELENELLGVSEAQARVIQALGMDRSKYSEAEINAITAEIEAYNQKQEAIERTKQIMDTVKSSMEDAFMSMVDGTMSAKDAFKSMAAEIIKELYRVLVVQQLVNSISGAIGGIFGGSAAPTSSPRPMPRPPGLAVGGSLMAGGSYLVGENGPELVTPRHSGTVVNANQTAAMGGGSGTTVVNNNISVTGSDAAMVRTEIAKMIPQITNATKAAVIDAKQRGGQMAAAFR